MRRVLDATILIVLAILIVVVIYLGARHPKAPCEMHSYTVVRFNPNADPLVRPTVGPGSYNPRLIFTEFMACGYEHVGDGKTVFYTDVLRDTLTDIVHVQDKGVPR